VQNIATAYGLWLNRDKSRKRDVIVGRDTRPSGKWIKEIVIESLINTDCMVIDADICPTPTILYEKNRANIRGAIIISGSHNPPEWNALKLVSETTFLNQSELDEISLILSRIENKKIEIPTNIKQKKKNVIKISPIKDYINAIYNNLDYKQVKKKNHLKIIVDMGAGSGKLVTPKLLKGLGCDVKVINNDFDENGDFPRGIEPVEKNLEDLIMKVWEEKADVGFAHDCDADRLGIVGDDFKCYAEDVGLALITDWYLKHYYKKIEKPVFITNVASSLRFDTLAKKYNAKVIRTPIGECYLAEKMRNLLDEKKQKKDSLVFGGEGSCGGVMLPSFNNARDGIFAAAKIVEIIVHSGKKISELVSELPVYYNYREKINIEGIKIEPLIKQIKQELISEGEDVYQIENDLRFGKDLDWFVLIHPSNTEPVIRIIAEAKRDSLARIHGQAAAQLVQILLDKM
jgi:phosphomannomutase